MTGRSRPLGVLPFALAASLEAALKPVPGVPGYPIADTLTP
jgi:hypothetical protein